MAVSSTTFAQRMETIKSGKTTSWTVPGQGLASASDERSFLRKSGHKMAARSTHKRINPFMFLLALVAGAVSVIAARWIAFTYLDAALAFAAEKSVDGASIIGSVRTASRLAVVISIVAMFALRLGSKQTVPLQIVAFLGALLFEGDLVALAPEIYARFYPQSWIVDMMASATLLT